MIDKLEASLSAAMQSPAVRQRMESVGFVVPTQGSRAYTQEPWLEHVEWLEPMFNQRLELKNGRMLVPDRPGLGFSLSPQALAWTAEKVEFGRRP